MRKIGLKLLSLHRLVCMSFKGCPSVFVTHPPPFRLMQGCLANVLFVILHVYLDDIIVFSSTFEEHICDVMQPS